MLNQLHGFQTAITNALLKENFYMQMSELLASAVRRNLGFRFTLMKELVPDAVVTGNKTKGCLTECIQYGDQWAEFTVPASYVQGVRLTDEFYLITKTTEDDATAAVAATDDATFWQDTDNAAAEAWSQSTTTAAVSKPTSPDLPSARSSPKPKP